MPYLAIVDRSSAEEAVARRISGPSHEIDVRHFDVPAITQQLYVTAGSWKGIDDLSHDTFWDAVREGALAA